MITDEAANSNKPFTVLRSAVKNSLEINMACNHDETFFTVYCQV